jgi:hypothetical protein
MRENPGFSGESGCYMADDWRTIMTGDGWAREFLPESRFFGEIFRREVGGAAEFYLNVPL